LGGLLTAVHLQKSGVNNVRIIEKAGDFGGCWYWNRYPGVACDVESYIYLPLLEELNITPKEKYARGAEVLAHSKAIAEKYNLYASACFQTEVTELTWDESKSRWTIFTNRNDRIRAKFVCMSNGPLNRPKLPGIPGIKKFKGNSFHTSRWDFNFTGGDSTGDLTKLKDKRVGVVGTGASAVQCIPHLGLSAKQVTVFQRTPPAVGVRNDQPTDPEWAHSQEPGWQSKRIANFTNITSGGMVTEDLVNDGWTDLARDVAASIFQKGMITGEALSPTQINKELENADFKKMEQIRNRISSIVKDDATAEVLKPYYNYFCKRPCFHDEYLATFNRENVQLIDTQGKGVDEITENGVVVGGIEYPLDCIIYATGFEVGTSYTRRSGYDLIGREGISLKEKWSKGISTLHGMHTRGFPNCFIAGNAQAALTINYPHSMNEQSIHVAYIISHCLDNDVGQLEVSEPAEKSWVQQNITEAKKHVRFLAACTPGFYSNEGKLNQESIQNASYGAGPAAYFKLLKEWREDGTLPGLEKT